MARPVRRNKKVVDYSQFGDGDNDDDDFASVTVHSKKKPRRECSESKEKKIDQQKQSRKDDIQSQKSHKPSPNEIVVLDDKLYKRDVEIALALSVNEPSENSNILQDSQKQDDDFASVTVHSKKKPRRECSESKEEKIDQQKQSRKDDIQSQKSQKPSPNEIVVLDDKLYKRDMEIALALSVNEPSENSNILEDSQKQDAAGHHPNPTQRKGVLTKSPTQGLRLGLSRLAKVKPLHPHFANV